MMIKKYIYIFIIGIIIAQNEVCFDIGPNTNTNPGFDYFTKYVNVLDCFDIYAEENISDDKVLHAAAVAAELLDNNEDGIVDDLLIKEELSNREALIPIFRNEWSDAADDFFDNYNGDGASAVLFNFEIDPNNTGHWGDDATVEEVVHVINHIGHVSIYPDWFSLQPNSSYMSDAMDVARGGQFINHPDEYPEEAWYHYDDWTCDYECMAIEYLYWCIVTDMGILDDIQTCNGIANEWEPCSPELFEETDLLMYALINNSDLMLPQLAPDGNYCPENYILGDINGDQLVDVLDVILTVNMILGISETNYNADLNNDGAINIQDIILIVNIILSNQGYNLNNNVSDSQFWNQCYIDKNTGWDLGEVTPVFKDWCNNLKEKSKILVPGSGNGYDPLYFASLGHDVLAVDFSDLAINRIESEADKNKIKIQSLNCDFFDLDSKFKNQFDYIIEYTFFCAISPNDRDKYITITHNLLNNSGSLIGLFFPLNKDKADGGPPFSVSLEGIKDSFSKKFKLINCFKYPLSIEPRKNNEQYFEYKKILV